MDTAAKAKSRRRRGVFRTLLALGVVAAFAFVAVHAFRLGTMAGLATGAGLLVVYAVPAAILDWPRLTVQDLIDFVSEILSAIAAFFAGLFD